MIKTAKKLNSHGPKAEPLKREGPIKVAAHTSEAPSSETGKMESSRVVEPKAYRVSLEFTTPGAKRVCVAGSFNGWKPEKTPLVPTGNGRWVGDLAIDPGKYEYLFVVDGQWLPDPNAKESVQNPFGGRNSILVVST